MFENVTCPHCDADPVNLEEAMQEAHLVSLGYMHTDIVLRCDSDHTWTHGVPHGDPETTDLWTCDVCNDSWYIPRDIAMGVDDRLQVVVKCMSCSHKPDQPLRFEIPDEDTGNNVWRILLGHPLVCGNTDEATEHNAKLIQ